MQKLFIIILLLASIHCLAQPAAKGPHGGSLSTAGYFKAELVNCNEYVEVYLYDLYMQPVFNHSFSGQVDFYFTGNYCYTAQLYHYDIDAFTAEVKQPCYTSCVVTLHGVGINIKAEFAGFMNSDTLCAPADKYQLQN